MTSFLPMPSPRELQDAMAELGVFKKAAQALGVDRRTLRRHLDRDPAAKAAVAEGHRLFRERQWPTPLTEEELAAERWLPVPGVSGYEVSDYGRVRSLNRSAPLILNPILSDQGYLRLTVALAPGPDGRKRSRVKRVHQMVLEAFVGPRPTGQVTRHLDGTRTNNRLSNLCWGTPSENGIDRTEHGRDPDANKTHCPQDHPYDDVNTRYYTGRNGRTWRACHTCERARGSAA